MAQGGEMKVVLRQSIKGLSGQLDGLIYYYHPRLKRTLARKCPEMPIQPQNMEYGNIARQIKALEPSEGYRNDFRIYLSYLRDSDESVRYPSWYSLYIKMMWAMQARYPEVVDLKTITREQIYDLELPCRTVQAAAQDGLLAWLPCCSVLNHSM